jgi:hypothetical protein
METSIMAILLAFNILIIYWKLSHARYADGILDFSTLSVIAYIFNGSTQTLMIGTGASAIISLYFLAFPPKFLDDLVGSRDEFNL